MRHHGKLASASTRYHSQRLAVLATLDRPKNEIAEAPPSRRERVGLIAGRAADHLNVGRSADRRRWLGAPLAHEDSARVRVTLLNRWSFNAACWR